MSRERRLYFGVKPPMRSQVREFLVDYCGKAAKRVYWQPSGRRYYVTLIGARRVEPPDGCGIIRAPRAGWTRT